MDRGTELEQAQAKLRGSHRFPTHRPLFGGPPDAASS